MDWTWYGLLAIALVTGLIVNLFSLPGLWLMVASAAAYAWVTGWQYVGIWTLVSLLAIGVLAELVEFAAGSAGARNAGGSRRAAWGALLGGIVGAIFLSIPLPVIGTIFGACLGAFLGAVLAELSIHGRTRQSLEVGWGAAKGRFWGIISKLGFSLIVLIVALWAALPLEGRRHTAPATIPSTIPG